MLRVPQISGMANGCRWRIAFTDHMRHFDSCEWGCSGMKCFETHHWLGDPFDKAVVLLKDIIEIFDLPDFNDSTCSGEFQDRIYGLQASQIGAAFVNDNPLGSAVSCNGFLEEAPRCSQIPAPR